jgi:ribosome-interacting GTPase 1
MVRIYTKPRGQIPDYNAPVILHRDARTVENLCDRIHKGILKSFKRALVWGASVKHQPQTGSVEGGGGGGGAGGKVV